MIYLITGVPGSGKTLYAISTLVSKLLSEKIKDKSGAEIKRRLLVDGVPDLIMEHETLAPMVEYDGPQVVNGVKQEWACDGDGLLNWSRWCKPGDLILIDEVQRYWRPRGMGSKPPDMIKMLETHRHFGVDFIIITQNPMLIDQNVRRLVGRHQHVRRLFGMARAIIYDWDSCSMDVNRTKGATTSTWGYPKKAYELYKSSALHLKQRQKIPLWLAVPVLALIGMIAIAPTAFATLSGAMSGRGLGNHAAPVVSAAASAPGRDLVTMVPPIAAAAAPIAAAAAPVVALAASAPGASVDAPKFAGCIQAAGRCGCFDSKGVKIEVVAAVCKDTFASVPSNLHPLELIAGPVDLERAAGDAAVFADLKLLKKYPFTDRRESGVSGASRP